MLEAALLLFGGVQPLAGQSLGLSPRDIADAIERGLAEAPRPYVIPHAPVPPSRDVGWGFDDRQLLEQYGALSLLQEPERAAPFRTDNIATVVAFPIEAVRADVDFVQTNGDEIRGMCVRRGRIPTAARGVWR
jgi:hypothetical protein